LIAAKNHNKNINNEERATAGEREEKVPKHGRKNRKQEHDDVIEQPCQKNRHKRIHHHICIIETNITRRIKFYRLLFLGTPNN
jgi:hypothetical protein